MTSQVGVNAGLNEVGLSILMSYLDYRGATEVPADGQTPLLRESDRRGAFNAAVLSRCRTVDESLDVLYSLAPKYPNGPGGNHILADASGTIAVFEHCGGNAQHHYEDTGYVARANNGLLILQKEQRQLSAEIVQDREMRYRWFIEAVHSTRKRLQQGLPQSEVVSALKTALASHHPDGPAAPGSICAHGVVVPGARSSLALPYWTLTAVIFDLGSRAMTYSVGNPCLGRWETLTVA